MQSHSYAGAGLIGLALVIAGCHSPARTIRPAIYSRPESKYQAMKLAPVIVIAEVLDYKLITGPRKVLDPGNALNPPRWIPLHLARISANAVLGLRGNLRGPIQFYSWVWASGQHGGERLFRPLPGYWHVLFLREDNGYLHTVGDYPGYDLPIPRDLVTATLAGLQTAPENGSDVVERIVSVLLRSELESANGIYWSYTPNTMDAEGLTSWFYVAGLLESFCRHLANPFGRFAACMALPNEFSGRCEAYRLALEADSAGVEAERVTAALARCEAQKESAIAFYRSNGWLDPTISEGWRPNAERHRLAMRLYASAMDPDFRAAACEAAADMPEAHDIPECGASSKARTR